MNDHPASSGLLMESELMMTLMGRPNQMEAVTAVFTRRPPKFKEPAATA